MLLTVGGSRVSEKPRREFRNPSFERRTPLCTPGMHTRYFACVSGGRWSLQPTPGPPGRGHFFTPSKTLLSLPQFESSRQPWEVSAALPTSSDHKTETQTDQLQVLKAAYECQSWGQDPSLHNSRGPHLIRLCVVLQEMSFTENTRRVVSLWSRAMRLPGPAQARVF